MIPQVPALRVRRLAMVVLALVLLAGLWELYKAVIPPDGVTVGDKLVLPRSDDASMPHVWEVFSVFGDSEPAGGTVADSVVSALWYSLRLAAAGFAVGVVVGMLLALLMQRFGLARRAMLPYVVVSQTVPPAASESPNAPNTSQTCGIDASSLRGSTSLSPTVTPSGGMTAL